MLVMSAVSVSELYDHLGRQIGEQAVSVRLAAMKARKIWIADVDETIASDAGRIKLSQAEVPLADAIIAATAKTYAPTVYTDDPHFEEIKGIKVDWRE